MGGNKAGIKDTGKQAKPTKGPVGKGNSKATKAKDKKGSKGGEEEATPTVLWNKYPELTDGLIEYILNPENKGARHVLKFHPGEGKKKIVDGTSAASHHRQMAISVVKPHASDIWKNGDEGILTTSVKNRLVVSVGLLLLRDKEADLSPYLSIRKQFYEWKKTLDSTGEGVQGGLGGTDADNKIEECIKDFPWYEALKDLYLDHPVLDNSSVLNSQSARGLSFVQNASDYQDDDVSDKSDGNGSDQWVGGGEDKDEEEEEEEDVEQGQNNDDDEEYEEEKEKKPKGDQKGKGKKFVKTSDIESADDGPPKKKAKKIEEKTIKKSEPTRAPNKSMRNTSKGTNTNAGLQGLAQTIAEGRIEVAQMQMAAERERSREESRARTKQSMMMLEMCLKAEADARKAEYAHQERMLMLSRGGGQGQGGGYPTNAYAGTSSGRYSNPRSSGNSLYDDMGGVPDLFDHTPSSDFSFDS